MDRQDRINLLVAATVVVLLVAGYWVVSSMQRHRAVEECLMARRRNCDQLLVP